MVSVIQTDGNEFTNVTDGTTHAWLAAHQWQIGRFESSDFGQLFVAQMLWGDVFDDTSQIAQFTVGVNQTGFLAANCAVTYKFHVCS
jgi:hypothetical protein